DPTRTPQTPASRIIIKAPCWRLPSTFRLLPEPMGKSVWTMSCGRLMPISLKPKTEASKNRNLQRWPKQLPESIYPISLKQHIVSRNWTTISISTKWDMNWLTFCTIAPSYRWGSEQQIRTDALSSNTWNAALELGTRDSM